MMTINFEHLDHTICLSQVYLGVHSGLKIFFSAIIFYSTQIFIFLRMWQSSRIQQLSNCSFRSIFVNEMLVALALVLVLDLCNNFVDYKLKMNK